MPSGWARVLVSVLLLAGPLGDAARADGGSTLRATASRFRDADGVQLQEQGLEAEQPAAIGGAWRWRAARSTGGRDQSTGEAREAGLDWSRNDDDAAPLLLRRAGLALRSDRPTVHGGIELGLDEWQVGLSREPMVWWAGLSATKLSVQLSPSWRDWQLVVAAERWQVSDGNHVYGSAWRLQRAQADETLGLFLTGYRRVADRHAAQYWSPERAEAGFGPGVQWHAHWGGWRVDGTGVSLYPLNGASRPAIRYDMTVEWSITPTTVLGFGWEGGRGRLTEEPYWSRSQRLYLSCRCLEGQGR